jgi:DNA-binding NtrC family response regulator
MDGLIAYDWPGNIRELKNLMEWAALKCAPPIICWKVLQERLDGPVAAKPESAEPEPVPFVGSTLLEVAEHAANHARKAFAEHVVAQHNGNKEAAAKQLECSVQYLYRVLKAE